MSTISSINELMDTIQKSDVNRVAEVLEELGITKNAPPSCITPASHRLMSATLSFASIAAWHETLTDDMAYEIINRVARAVNTFSLIKFVIAGAKISTNDYDAIPKELISNLQRNEFDDKAAEVVAALDESTFAALLSYVDGSDTVTALKRDFGLSLVRYIYAHRVVPADLMFSFMANCLDEPLVSQELMRVLEASLLGSFIAFLRD